MWVLPYVAPDFLVRKFTSSSTPIVESFESWEGLTLEEQLRRASVVLITENREERGMIRAYIKEVLKQSPGTVFHYAVGDEYLPLAETPRENVRYGDGSLVLLQGSPAEMRTSDSIYNGQLPGHANLPLKAVRELVAQEH
jgi:hypothetical protein